MRSSSDHQPATVPSSKAAWTPGSQATIFNPYDPSFRSRMIVGRNMLAIYDAVETRQPGARSGSTSSVTAQPPTMSRRSNTATRFPAFAR